MEQEYLEAIHKIVTLRYVKKYYDFLIDLSIIIFLQRFSNL